MTHTILLISSAANPASITYSYYSSVNKCMEGVLDIYQEHLTQLHPNSPIITYESTELFDFLDQFADLSCLVYENSTSTFVSYNKDWIKEKIYLMFEQAAE